MIGSVAAEGASVKPVAGLTFNVNVVVSVVLPEVPVMVTVNEPVEAALVAVRVRTLEVADDAGLNDAVTPLGRPDAAKVTLPVKLPTSVTVMVPVAVLP